MTFRLLAFPFALLCLTATTCLAEGASPSPAEDLATLKLRAGQSQQGFLQLNELAAQVQRGVPLNEMLGGILNVPPDAFAGGLRYAVAGKVRLAQKRADKYAMILSNDLDGDGSVSRDEIADTLAFGQSRRTGAAETLIIYDKDRDDTLSPEEIRVAVSDVFDTDSGRDEGQFASVFDLDQDGTLTTAELQRVDAALRLPEALQ